VNRRKLIRVLAAVQVILLVIAVAGFMRFRSWSNQTFSPFDGQALATPQTRLFLRYELRETDPGATDLVRAVLSELDDRGAFTSGQLRVIRWMGYADLDAFAESLMPVTVGLLVEQDLTAVKFVSFSKHANVICSALQRKLPQGEATVIGNTILFSKDRERLARAIAALKDPPKAQPELLSHLSPRQPLTMALLDQKQFLDAGLAWARDKRGVTLKQNMRSMLNMGAQEFEWITLNGVLGHRKLRGTLVLGLSPKGMPAEMVRGSIKKLLELLVGHLLHPEVRFEHAARLEGRDLEVDLTLDGLDHYWRTWLGGK